MGQANSTSSKKSIFNQPEKSMKAGFNATTAALILAVFAGGCASTSPLPTGMVAGKFVAYACDGGKQFQARAADDGSTVRIRYEGGYELDRMAKGIYEGSGWKLVTADASAGAPAELSHNGKVVLKACKLA
jgi:hypothetical protein